MIYIYIALQLKATVYKRLICLDLGNLNLNTKRTVYTGQWSELHMIMQCKNKNDFFSLAISFHELTEVWWTHIQKDRYSWQCKLKLHIKQPLFN